MLLLTQQVHNTFIISNRWNNNNSRTDYKVHTFTGPGTFHVLQVRNCSSEADYVVVAGGGGGGPACHAGGGGAGGFRESHNPTTSGPYTASPLAAPNSPTSASLPFSIGSFPITVGAGGSSSPLPSNSNGGHGSDSIFSTITSTGGGGATTGDQNPNRDGGSGGGMRSTCGASYQGVRKYSPS